MSIDDCGLCTRPSGTTDRSTNKMGGSMNRTSNSFAIATGLLLTMAATAGAQTAPERRVFVDVGAGGQVSTRTFSATSAFVAFNEGGVISTNQNIGRGFVLDVSGGYRIRPNVSVIVGLWTAHPGGASASAASIPDPLVLGRPKTVTATATDLNQTDVGVNFQIGWSTLVGQRFRVSVAGGPTIIHVKQDVASIAVTPGTQTGVGSIVSESATTGKAGSLGLELGYQLTDRYGTGVFLRYAGGEVDLPSHSRLKVGGVQMGARVRLWF